MRVRPARPTDAPACYAIAVATGDAGASAADLHRYPDLIGDVYVGPYLALEPDSCFVLVDADDQVRGYAIGTADTRGFAERARRSWWPDAARRFAGVTDTTAADRALLAAITAAPAPPDPVVDAYPAHGHIDLLPSAQGLGCGRALMERLLHALAEAGASGIHLGVDPANTNALGFYRRLGFTTASVRPGVVYVVRSLATGAP